MNKNCITERLRNKSKETGVNYSILQAFFFYEEFLKHLSKSSYKENFILKGGLLVSAMAGILLTQFNGQCILCRDGESSLEAIAVEMNSKVFNSVNEAVNDAVRNYKDTYSDLVKLYNMVPVRTARKRYSGLISGF